MNIICLFRTWPYSCIWLCNSSSCVVVIIAIQFFFLTQNHLGTVHTIKEKQLKLTPV